MSYSGKTYSGVVGGDYQGRRELQTFNTQLFDTTLPGSLRGTVLLGVCDRLKRLLKSNPNGTGFLAGIEPITSPIKGFSNQEDLDQLFDQLRGRAPGVVVAVGDATYDPAGDVFEWTKPLDVHVYYFCNSLRSRFARQTGDVVSANTEGAPNADPGSFVALEHIEELLIGQIPGGNIGRVKQLRPRTERLLIDYENIELWEQLYSVMLPRRINEHRDRTTRIKTIVTQHRLSDHQLPTDPPIVTTDDDVG